MRKFLLLTLLASWPAAAQTPEELYQDYMTPETRAIKDFGACGGRPHRPHSPGQYRP
ncbi:MAG: hypothetical protein II824_10080 [Bacteroidales bacterium]|nr:hypothetical protein [Bacteroidales bacterium]